MPRTIAVPPLKERSLIPKEISSLDDRSRRIVIGIALAGCLLRLFFWQYTHRTWEDALISVLHSENVGLGLGLTHHHPGYPPLHGFTSPLSVLVPLMADIFHPGWGLLLIKMVSAVIAIPTVLLGAAIALNRAFFVNIWLVYLLCAYLALEHHQVLLGHGRHGDTDGGVRRISHALPCAEAQHQSSGNFDGAMHVCPA